MTRIGAALLIGAGAYALLNTHAGTAKTPPGALSTETYPAGFCRTTDGDTIRCGDERVRLVEIDAPELKGHCAKGRVCAPGDGNASKAHMVTLITGQAVTVVRYGKDKYQRTLADARVGDHSLSCAMVTSGYAIRQLKWGSYGVLAKECPE